MCSPVYRNRCAAGLQHHAAASAAPRAVAIDITGAGRLCWPGVAADPSIGVDGKAREGPGFYGDNHSAPGAASPAIVYRGLPCRTVSIDGAGTCDVASAQNDDAAPCTSTGVVVGCIVVGGGTASTAQGKLRCCSRECGSAETTLIQRRIPGETTLTSRSSITTPATSGVLVIRLRVGFGTAASRIAGCAAVETAIRVAI